MLKSVGVVIGSYVLSVVLVFATDPLLSLIFPGEFAKGNVPSNRALIASTAFELSRWRDGRCGVDFPRTLLAV